MKAEEIYTSHLQGPGIDDYAQWIIEENPDILILVGPPGSLFRYMLNRINLQRAIDSEKGHPSDS